jgi:hypothetical protein
VDVDTEGDGVKPGAEESGDEESDEQAAMDATSATITAIDTRCTAPKVAGPHKGSAEGHVHIVQIDLAGATYAHRADPLLGAGRRHNLSATGLTGMLGRWEPESGWLEVQAVCSRLPQFLARCFGVEGFQSVGCPRAQRRVLSVQLLYEQWQRRLRSGLPDEFEKPTSQAVIVVLSGKLSDQLIDMLGSVRQEKVEAVGWLGVSPAQAHRQGQAPVVLSDHNRR